ncbi:MAG: hypothetical protein QXP86_05910 [Nitrososphaerota archaeon]
MGVLPGQKFVWLKAKGDPNVPPNSVKINNKYMALLKVPEKEPVEVVYEGELLFKAEVTYSADAPRGYAFINKNKMVEFKIPEEEAVIVAEPREKAESE